MGAGGLAAPRARPVPGAAVWAPGLAGVEKRELAVPPARGVLVLKLKPPASKRQTHDAQRHNNRHTQPILYT